LKDKSLKGPESEFDMPGETGGEVLKKLGKGSLPPESKKDRK